MHPEALEAVRRMVNTSGYINAPRLVRQRAVGERTGVDAVSERLGLDLGGADVNGTARSIIPDVTEWYGLDIAEGEGVDLVADATDATAMSAYNAMFDIVLCTELLEHVEDWRAVLDNAWTVLAPGGFAFFTFAGTDVHTWARRPHGARGEHHVPDGEYYGNVPLAEFVAHFAHLVPADHDFRGMTGPASETWSRPVPGDIYCWFRK